MVYQLKISLKYSEPEIWRRVLIPADMTLLDLHDVIQVSMGWEDCHLFQFMKDDKLYAIREDSDFTWDEKKYIECTDIIVTKLLTEEGDKIEYEYDFGDSWIHTITLEKIFEDKDIDGPLPHCIEGERECPPEDCGGIPGYNYMLAVLKDPNHDDYNDIREYFGFGPDEEIDLNYVDFEEINMTFEAIF